MYCRLNNSPTLLMTVPAPAPNYSCLLPPSFTGLRDVEDFITHFEAVASFSNWSTLNPDPRPHLFSARLTGDALTFYWSLTPVQKSSFEELKLFSGVNTNLMQTFWRRKWSPCVNYRERMFPPSTGHYAILPVRHMMIMQFVRIDSHHLCREVGQFCGPMGSAKRQISNGGRCVVLANERGGCAVDPIRLNNAPAILNSVVGENCLCKSRSMQCSSYCSLRHWH